MLTNAILYKEPMISNKCLINATASFIMYVICPGSPGRLFILSNGNPRINVYISNAENG